MVSTLSVNKVSVVVCTYNGAAFIKEQLISLLNQTRPADEILVLDDGSSDGTLSKIEELRKEHSMIRIITNESNLGFNKNFEKGFQLATGNIIAPCDQDDIWHPQKLEILLVNWSKDTPLIYCDSTKFSGTIPLKPALSRQMRRLQGQEPLSLAIRNTVSGHALLFRKELLSLALPFESNIYYDWWLAIVAMTNGGIQFVPQVLVYQRTHAGNQTLNLQASKKEQSLDYVKMLLQHLKKFSSIPNLGTERKKFFEDLHHLWLSSVNEKRHFPLFIFLIKNRAVLFQYKKRKFPFISQLKHSFLFAYK